LACNATAFRKGSPNPAISKAQNLTVEYHWLEAQYDRLSALVADLVRRRVAVIATSGSNVAALPAKAGTATVPIVFGVSEDLVQLGLVTSLARPVGNPSGINFSRKMWWPSGCGSCMTWCSRSLRIAVPVNPSMAIPHSIRMWRSWIT
jgi:hypothetical protein